MGLNPRQFRSIVVDPVLRDLGLWSPAASNLVFGTAAHESKLVFLAQFPAGPALGVYQIEPMTHKDLYDNFLIYHPDLLVKVTNYLAHSPDRDTQLATNLDYATAICRLLYYRHPEPLPDADDTQGLAAMWKRVFNTPQGAGTVAEWVSDYQRFSN